MSPIHLDVHLGPPARLIDPIDFKLLFTAPERIAIKNSTDPVVQDFYELVEQQREANMREPSRGRIDLGLQSTADALAYLSQLGILVEGRAAQILEGKIR